MSNRPSEIDRITEIETLTRLRSGISNSGIRNSELITVIDNRLLKLVENKSTISNTNSEEGFITVLPPKQRMS